MYVQKENEEWQANYDESQVPPFTLPELLKTVDGRPIATAAEWEANRPLLLQQFRDVMYGRRLPLPDKVSYELISEKKDAVGGLAVRREIRLTFSMNNGRSHSVVMILFIPAGAKEKVPVFTGLTFIGNHVICDDPDVTITGLAGAELKSFTRERGIQKARFPLAELMKEGFALAVCSYHDFFPDFAGGWPTSVLRIFFSEEELRPRLPDASAIGVWAWGLSRMLDYLETVPEIDASKAAVYGHSRLGKTSLWAGAEDTRFKLVCVNDSGCGGAAPNRRLFGETLYCMSRHSDGFGHYWFTHTLAPHAMHPEELPIDQHQLIALIAPRAVAVHSATEDQWADPRGEYLSAWSAGPAFRLYGLEPLQSATPPPPDTPVGTDVSYFLREGKHNILLSDWECYMAAFRHVLARK